MKLRVVEQSDHLTHIALEGDLDVEGVNAIENAVYFNLTARRKPAIVELAGVRFVGSLGIGMLVRVAQSLRRQGCRMVLLNPSPKVDEAIRVLGLELVIPVAKSREEALSGLR